MDFDEFVRAYAARLRAIVASMAVGRDGDIEDVVQEALTRAYEKRATLASEAHAFNWVCHVARCLLIDESRSWYRRNVVTGAEIAAVDVTAGDDPADVVVANEDRRRAVRSVAALSAAQRQLLWDHAVEGESYADIARRTATPLATVRSNAHRARVAAQHRFGRAAGGLAALPSFARRRTLDWWSRWRPALSGDNAVAYGIAVSLLLGGLATGPAARAETGFEPVRLSPGAVARPLVVAPPRAPAPTPLPDAPPPRPSPTPSPTATPWQPPAYQEVRFDGTYSRRCDFAPTGSGTFVYHQYKYSCTLTARSTTCLSLSTSADLGCRADLVSGVMRGNVWVYAEPVVDRDVYCDGAGGTSEDLAASVGVIEYVDRPGVAPVRVPVRLTYDVTSTKVMISRTAGGPDPKFGITAELPFTCESVVESRSGFSGRTTYGTSRGLVDSIVASATPRP